eukprot:GHVN01039858.1.p1 GENE.GHVN01039858.1~~GHVN01039858.1.p1  ORF type:complete len:307 (-),score=65.22 GHVN01039858.1:355-1275(-)
MMHPLGPPAEPDHHFTQPREGKTGESHMKTVLYENEKSLQGHVPSVEEVCVDAVEQIAILHSSHFGWGEKHEPHTVRYLAQHCPWIKHSGLLSEAEVEMSQAKTEWMKAQKMGFDAWSYVKYQLLFDEDYKSKIRFSPRLYALIDASMAKIDFENYLNKINKYRYKLSLIHGDFHPGNVLWDVRKRKTGAVVDFEMLGFAWGGQDVGQYMISHINPQQRRLIEGRVCKAYFNRLTKLLGDKATGYNYDEFFRDYITGGVYHWVWMLSILGWLFPPPALQYFHDHLEAFVEDHNVGGDGDEIEMPRV